MANTLVSFRLSDETLAKIDRIAEELSKKARGVHITRTEAVKLCLDRGIAIVEEELISKPPPARKR